MADYFGKLLVAGCSPPSGCFPFWRPPIRMGTDQLAGFLPLPCFHSLPLMLEQGRYGEYEGQRPRCAVATHSLRICMQLCSYASL